MKKGQIKINLSDVWDMKAQMDRDHKIINDLTMQSNEDFHEIKELNNLVKRNDEDYRGLEATAKEIGSSPFLYVGKYFIPSDDMDRVAEADFNANFKKFLEVQFKKKK